MLGIGAFLMQVAVQGAWGIVPVHLNELSPPLARAMFPGFAYQIGNLIMAKNVVFQAGIAESRGDNYGLALALFGGIMAVAIVIWTLSAPSERADFTPGELLRLGGKPSRAPSRVARSRFGPTCRAIREPPTRRDRGKGDRCRRPGPRRARVRHPLAA